MEYIFHPYIVNSALSAISLYVITATVFLLTTKLKDDEGNMWIDTDSLHFKITHPFYEYSFLKANVEEGVAKTSLCGYFLEFFLSLYIAWPLIIFWQTLKTILYTPLLLMFGYYPNPFRISAMVGYGCNPFSMELCKYRLPEVRGFKLLPFYILFPALYIYMWTIEGFVHTWMVKGHLWGGGIILAIAIIVTLASVYDYFDRKLLEYDNGVSKKEMGIVKARFKYRKMCPILKIR